MREAGRYEVVLACLDRSGPLLSKIPQTDRQDIPEFKLTTFYDLNMVRQTARFARWLKRQNIHVVHTHDFYTNIFGMTGAALASVPVRVASRREASKRAAHKRFIERRAYQLASAVIANCEHVRGELIAEGLNPDKLFTVYNGVLVPRRSKPKWANDEFPVSVNPVICIVANLRPVKDHAAFLRAAKRVIDHYPQARFLLAGEGSLEASLRAQAAELGVTGSVDFLGRCDNVPELLQRVDICVLTSKSEGFPNVVLEYMAAAKPVVATAVGGVVEAITDGHNGFVVTPGDDLQIADRIVRLLNDRRQAREMGERGYRIVAERFSPEVQLRRVELLYERLLTNSPQLTSSADASRMDAAAYDR